MGMQFAIMWVRPTTPEQRAEWAKVLLPVWPKMVQEVGGDAPNFFKQMEAAKASCAKKS